MKRLGIALLPLAFLVSACAVGVPLPPTSPSLLGTSIVLNAKVNSSIDGPTDYWFRYGERGDQANWSETSHQTVEITDEQAESVSAQLAGLEPSHRYGWQVCVADQQEDPPRVVCSTEQQFGTVGDLVVGGNTGFNVRSGPGGENPAGDVAGEPVTCMRVQSASAATVGIEAGVYHLKLIENTSPEVFQIEFVAWPDGSDHTNCPQPNPQGPGLDQHLSIQDAP
jgi:hypothetical protein